MCSLPPAVVTGRLLESWCQLPTRSPVHQVSHEGWAPLKGDNGTRNTPLCTEPLSFHKGELDWALHHSLDGNGDLDEYQAGEQQNMLWSFVIKSHLLLKLGKLIGKNEPLPKRGLIRPVQESQNWFDGNFEFLVCLICQYGLAGGGWWGGATKMGFPHLCWSKNKNMIKYGVLRFNCVDSPSKETRKKPNGALAHPSDKWTNGMKPACAGSQPLLVRRGTELSQLVWTPPLVPSSQTEPRLDRTGLLDCCYSHHVNVRGEMVGQPWKEWLLFVNTVSDFWTRFKKKKKYKPTQHFMSGGKKETLSKDSVRCEHRERMIPEIRRHKVQKDFLMLCFALSDFWLPLWETWDWTVLHLLSL